MTDGSSRTIRKSQDGPLEEKHSRRARRRPVRYNRNHGILTDPTVVIIGSFLLAFKAILVEGSEVAILSLATIKQLGRNNILFGVAMGGLGSIITFLSPTSLPPSARHRHRFRHLHSPVLFLESFPSRLCQVCDPAQVVQGKNGADGERGRREGSET